MFDMRLTPRRPRHVRTSLAASRGSRRGSTAPPSAVAPRIRTWSRWIEPTPRSHACPPRPSAVAAGGAVMRAHPGALLSGVHGSTLRSATGAEMGQAGARLHVRRRRRGRRRQRARRWSRCRRIGGERQDAADRAWDEEPHDDARAAGAVSPGSPREHGNCRTPVLTAGDRRHRAGAPGSCQGNVCGASTVDRRGASSMAPV